MIDLFPKWIIEDGKLRIGKCSFHKELCSDKEKVSGGGWCKLNFDEKYVIFYSSSHDFGNVNLDQMKAAKENGTKRVRLKDLFENYEWRFSTSDSLLEANLNYKII